MKTLFSSFFKVVLRHKTLLIYFILPYLFFAWGIDFLHVPLAPGDGVIQGVPTKIFSAGLHLWNPYIQTGTFPFKDIGWQALYLPGILVMRIFPNPFGYNLLLLAHYSMAGFSTFLYLKKLNLKRIASFIGGISFMFCGFLAAHKGHHTMVMAASYLPVILYLFETFLSTKKASRLFLTALAFGLSILADYTAVSMYIGMILLPYILFRVFTGQEYRDKTVLKKIIAITGITMTIFGAGIMVAAVEVLPIIESLKYINREEISYSFFSSYSFDYKLLPLLIFPFFFGTHSPSFYQPAYFGPWNLTELAGYMGILPIVFAILSIILFRKRNLQIYFWTAVALFAFILVLGDSTPLYQLMYRVPVYNMFRVPARNWLEANFAVAILSSFFIHYLITDTFITRKRYLSAASTVVVLLFAVIVIILASARNWNFTPEIKRLLLDNVRINSPAIYIPLVIVLLSTILLYSLYRYRAGKHIWVVATVFLFFDLFSFGHFHDTAGFLRYKLFQGQPNEIAGYLNTFNEDKSQYRIFPIVAEGDIEKQLTPNINILYGFNVVNGYSPIWLKDYIGLTTFEANGIALRKYELLNNQKILSLLSTKYIITSDNEVKGYLQTLLTGDNSTTRKLLVDGFDNGGWITFPSAKETGQNVILQSTLPGQVSLIQIPFALRPKTFYTINFQARLNGSDLTSNTPLIVDLFNTNYDLSQQEAQFDNFRISHFFQDINVVFFSGETTPNLAYLRFFTFSEQPYEIKEVKLIQNSDTPPGGTFSDDESNLNDATPLYNAVYESTDGIVVYENTRFLPRARFVKKVRVVDSSRAAINILWNRKNFNPSTIALVEDYNGPTELLNGEVINADFSDGSNITLSVKTGENGFLVISDSWYPGWKAYIDNKETKIYKTNAVSRGILITGTGEHTVELRFVPKTFYMGLFFSGMTLAVFFIYYWRVGAVK